MRSQRGQAAIEWVTLVFVCSIVLGALATFVPVFDGRSFGGFLSHAIFCAITGNCDDDGELAAAYGPRDATLVRRYAPGLVYEPGEKELPVDWRSCRKPACANAPDDRDLDAHRSGTGERATMFTHVVHRGGRTYIQYWFYYPDSNSTVSGSDLIWKASGPGVHAISHLLTGKKGYPGFHLDDWEGFLGQGNTL